MKIKHTNTPFLDTLTKNYNAGRLTPLLPDRKKVMRQWWPISRTEQLRLARKLLANVPPEKCSDRVNLFAGPHGRALIQMTLLNKNKAARYSWSK